MSMDEAPLRELAESMGMKKAENADKQELAYYIIDNASIETARAEVAKMKPKRGRKPRMLPQPLTRPPRPRNAAASQRRLPLRPRHNRSPVLLRQVMWPQELRTPPFPMRLRFSRMLNHSLKPPTNRRPTLCPLTNRRLNRNPPTHSPERKALSSRIPQAAAWVLSSEVRKAALSPRAASRTSRTSRSNNHIWTSRVRCLPVRS